ncbi:MAG: domain containing protein [Actinomycetia bacterium]|nr:domain containing protein [Actinomycetes bacterium]
MSSMDSSYAGAVALTSARAGFWRRFAAAFIDGILLGIVSFILQSILGNTGSGLTLLIGIAYYTYFHGSTGQTPGDAALSIRVVDKDGGGSIGYGRAFVRWLVSIVSGLVFLLGYLWMLWDGEKQTWHDKAANDVVVPTS